MITGCPNCGEMYEAASEESANEPLDSNPKARWCSVCFNSEWDAWGRRLDRQFRERLKSAGAKAYIPATCSYCGKWKDRCVRVPDIGWICEECRYRGGE